MASSKVLAWATAVIAGLLAYYGLVLASTVSVKYVWLLAVSGAIGLYSKGVFGRIAHEKLLVRLRSSWGDSGGIDRNRNFTDIERFFRLVSVPNNHFVIDDRTWEDLNGGLVFAKIDRALTVYGQQYLYSLLRVPVFEQDELKRRSRLIRFFQARPEVREQVQTILAKIGHYDAPNAISFLIDPPQIESLRYGWLYTLLSCLAIAGILAWVIGLQLATVAVVAVFVINLIIHTVVHKKISGYFHLIRALRRIVHFCRKLAAVDAGGWKLADRRIKEALTKTKAFMRHSSQVGLESVDPILGSLLEYVSILFLLDVRGFERAVAMIRKDRDALLTMYGWIGELDALQAVASFRESLPYYCEPVLKQGRESTEKLVGEEMYHPLLQDPVPNSLTVGNQGILITGSNMSGKSTFLRTVGTNALFAQTIYTCLAQAYRSQFVKLLTSIGRADNIIEGKSYYLVEAQSILRVLKAIEAESSVTVMAIFDEMYRGTNSEERIKAGCRVLEYAAQPGTIILVATHDLELTKMLEQGYANYHFGEKVGGHGLEFDYTLKLGPSQTRNAITLLKALGYPQAITD